MQVGLKHRFPHLSRGVIASRVSLNVGILDDGDGDRGLDDDDRGRETLLAVILIVNDPSPRLTLLLEYQISVESTDRSVVACCSGPPLFSIFPPIVTFIASTLHPFPALFLSISTSSAAEQLSDKSTS